MTNGWNKRQDRDTDDWERKTGTDDYCAITQYEGTHSYCWHAVRGEARLHGVIYGRDAAMQQADAIMALPVEEFNARAVAKLIDELRELEGRILRLAPTSSVLPGYHAGFEAGAANVKRTIATALDIVDERLERSQ